MHLVDGLSGGLGLGAGGIADVEKAIASAIGSYKENPNGAVGNVMLVLDGLDFLLAATGCEVLEILDMIAELREVRFLPLHYFYMHLLIGCLERNSTSTPPSLPQLPIVPFANRPLRLSKYPTRLL